MKLQGLYGDVYNPVGIQIDLKDVNLKIKDGGSNEITVKIGEGNLTYTESRNIEYTLDRGTLDEVREGDEVPMDVSFDFVWEYIVGDTSSSGAPPTVEDALKQLNNASDWTSSDSANPCRPYAVDLVLEHVPDCSTGDQEIITLADFRYESFDHDLREGTVSCSGRCNAKTATVARDAQSSGSPS